MARRRSGPDHPGAITLENEEILTDASAEVARIWITDRAGSSVWINAGLLEDPHIFGFLMADTIRHAARAYAGTWNIDEAAALQQIVDGLGEQLRDQFGAVDTIRHGSLN